MAVAGFEACPLRYQGASQSVFGRGNPKASVLVVGEGPGAEEDQRGEHGGKGECECAHRPMPSVFIAGMPER